MFLQEAATSKPESYRQRMNRFRFIPQSSFVNCFTHAEVFIADTKITKFYSDSKLIAKNKRCLPKLPDHPSDFYPMNLTRICPHKE